MCCSRRMETQRVQLLVLASPASLSRTPVESHGSPQPRTILPTLQVFLVGGSKASFFQKNSHLLEKSKE